MSAVEPQKIADVPAAGTTEPAPAPIEPVKIDKFVTPAEDVTAAPKTEEVKPAEAEAVAPVEEKKDEKPEPKVAEPIYSGALGYKAPGLKNAFRYSKKYFWFGEEPVQSTNLREYLRGEKPEIAHPVAAWSSQTGKGLLFFVKHADQKEHPAGALNLAYASDLHKDGTLAFALKISGHKHSFEAQSAPERDGWYVAVEKAVAEAKEAKDGIESSEAYKEQKEKLGKPTALAAATASSSTPKKSTDATPKLAETEAPATEEPAAATTAAAPARAGSSSSSSSDEEKKAKKAKSKSRSASRKRASIFGGLLGKKDKPEEKAEQKKEEPKVEADAVKAQPEVKKDEVPAAAPIAPIAPVAETSTTAPVITQDIPKASEELKTDVTPAPVAGVAAPVEEAKPEETTTKPTEEKPKPTKRGSIFGSFFEKVKSPTHEKKEADIVPAPAAKEATPAPEASKPLEEAQVTAPVVAEPAPEQSTLKTDEAKPVHSKPAVSTPTKEKEHFKFGGLFGKKDRAKSPAPASKDAPASEPSKVDAVAPKIEDTPAPVEPTPVEPVAAAPVTETKADPIAVQDKKDEASPAKKEEVPAAKKEKRGSIFGSLGRSLSKATKGNKEPKEKKETTTPTTVAETNEPKEDKADKTVSPLVDDKKDETPAAAAPAEKSIGDVVPEAVTVGEAPKSAPTVPTTA